MAQTGGGASGKRAWPDMRSLGWPPEGYEPKPGESAEDHPPGPAEAGGAAEPAGEAIPPFELAPDPGGSGGLVAVPVPEPPRLITTLEQPTAGPSATEAVDAAGAEPSPEAGDRDAAILAELRGLRRAVDALAAAVRGLGEAGVRPAVAAATLPARQLPDHQALQEIQDYFLTHPGETLYPAQIAHALGLPALRVAELCEALAGRGQLARSRPGQPG